MASNSKQRIDASKMLKFLKREEAFYEKTLYNMKQELVRLQIEELSLKAGIRTEQAIVEGHQNVDTISTNGCESLNEDGNSASDNVTSLSRRSKKTRRSKKIRSDENNSNSSSNLQGDDHSQNSMSQPSPGTMSQPSPGTMSQPSPGTMSQPSPAAVSQPSPAANDSVMSNITDERYLEPLILNPLPRYIDDAFVEFDD